MFTFQTDVGVSNYDAANMTCKRQSVEATSALMPGLRSDVR